MPLCVFASAARPWPSPAATASVVYALLKFLAPVRSSSLAASSLPHLCDCCFVQVIVDVAAAELGVDLGPVDTQVDVLGGANRSPEMLEKNPSGGVPIIELNDGTCISETVAIAAYLEDAESTNGECQH
jgi:hypothetical protein